LHHQLLRSGVLIFPQSDRWHLAPAAPLMPGVRPAAPYLRSVRIVTAKKPLRM
jgi:hypothetical protein